MDNPVYDKVILMLAELSDQELRKVIETAEKLLEKDDPILRAPR